MTGDFHGDKKRFHELKKAKLKKNDTLLICGDFGFVWDNSKAEKKMLKWIGKRKYHIAFVDGYNDNLTFIQEYPVAQWNGGAVYHISGKLVMLKRGEIYQIEQQTFFAFGGGDSIEREHDNHKFEDKLPSKEEMELGLKNLEKYHHKVDYIITHDAPAKIKLFIDMESNELTHLHTFLEKVSSENKFKKWFFGKYHMNKSIPISYQMLFTDIIKLDK